MAFKVEFAKKAVDDFMSFDKLDQALLIGWIKKNLGNTLNPRKYGKEMMKFHFNNWKYTVGDYRLLSYIDSDRIIVLDIEHFER